MSAYGKAMKRSHSRSPAPRGKPGSNATADAERAEVLATRPGDMHVAVRDKKPVVSSDPAVLNKLLDKKGG